jgi:hypothetical protein
MTLSLVKVGGALKTAAIARFFGTSGELDADWLTFLISSLIGVVLGRAIVPSPVPRLVELLDVHLLLIAVSRILRSKETLTC